VTRYPSFPYVAPFGVFLGLLALHSVIPMADMTDQALRLVVTAAALWFFSRPVLDFRVRHRLASVFIGLLVFVLWIAPDLLFPGYRQHWLFQNPLVGTPHSTLATGSQTQPAVLALRAVRAAVVVPIIEELFWRAWLMRWVIQPDFEKVPLGAYTPLSFWVAAGLFASEHGSYWEVGLVAGVIYNWWMIRTKSLGDLILTHAVTNACLSGYVIYAGKWEYWL
jgi:CAAX prenyl protease-like protein